MIGLSPFDLVDSGTLPGSILDIEVIELNLSTYLFMFWSFCNWLILILIFSPLSLPTESNLLSYVFKEDCYDFELKAAVFIKFNNFLSTFGGESYLSWSMSTPGLLSIGLEKLPWFKNYSFLTWMI